MSGQVIPDGDKGVWTMTDAEFRAELAAAWDAGAEAQATRYLMQSDPGPNPYRSRDD